MRHVRRGCHADAAGFSSRTGRAVARRRYGVSTPASAPSLTPPAAPAEPVIAPGAAPEVGAWPSGAVTGTAGAVVPAVALCDGPEVGVVAGLVVAGWLPVVSAEGVTVAAEPAAALSAVSRGPAVPGAGKLFPPCTGGSRSGLMQPPRQSAAVHANQLSARAIFFMNFRSLLTVPRSSSNVGCRSRTQIVRVRSSGVFISSGVVERPRSADLAPYLCVFRARNLAGESGWVKARHVPRARNCRTLMRCARTNRSPRRKPLGPRRCRPAARPVAAARRG